MKYAIFGKLLTVLMKPFEFVLTQLPTRKILPLVLLTSLLLSGCVNYDIGVNFNNSNRGEFVQHIKLEEKLTSLSGDYVYEWLNSIEKRARKLEGKAKRISREEVIVTIPFSNGEELQTKFNEFFSPHQSSSEPNTAESNSEIPKVESNFLLFQNNFLLAVRNNLIYDLDLRSLAVIASKGNVLADTGAILNLEFTLNTPWGANVITVSEDATPTVNYANAPEKIGNRLVWHLQPGELNHIEVVFWLPSPLGIGGLLIILFVWGGIYLRYTFMPDPRIQFAPKAVSAK